MSGWSPAKPATEVFTAVALSAVPKKRNKFPNFSAVKPNVKTAATNILEGRLYYCHFTLRHDRLFLKYNFYLMDSGAFIGIKAK